MKCSKCGNEFEEGKFCPECGGKPRKLSLLEKIKEELVSESPQPQLGIKCPKCGTEMEFKTHGLNVVKAASGLSVINVEREFPTGIELKQELGRLIEIANREDSDEKGK